MRPIDADALMQTLGITDMDCAKCKWYSRAYRQCKRGGDFEDACTAIEDAPTIEPQRMRGKGRWNVYYHGEENGKSIFSYSCNQCGYGAPYNFIGGVCEQKKWNFCPNCGADMRGTE